MLSYRLLFLSKLFISLEKSLLTSVSFLLILYNLRQIFFKFILLLIKFIVSRSLEKLYILPSIIDNKLIILLTNINLFFYIFLF